VSIKQAWAQLRQANLPNIAIWVVTAIAVFNFGIKAILAYRPDAFRIHPAVDLVVIFWTAITIVAAYGLVVWAAPSTRRWCLFAVVVLLFLPATAATLRAGAVEILTPISYFDLAMSLVTKIAIIGLLIWLRLNPPKPESVEPMAD
jgi:hypothetical protein